MKINEMHDSHFTHMAHYSQLTFILKYTQGKTAKKLVLYQKQTMILKNSGFS